MGLKHQQQAAGKRVHGFERGGDLVGVVGEVVDHGDLIGGAHDLQPPADAAELAQMRRGLREADAAGLRGTQRRERVGDVVQPRHFQRHLGGLAGVARRHLERDPGRRPDRRRRDEIGLRGIQTVGHRLSGLRIGRQRRGFRIVEIQHHRLRLGDEAAEQGAQLVQRFVIERDVVHHRHAGLEIGNRAVALVDFTDEDVAVADPGAGKRRARVDEVVHVRAVHDRRTFAGAVQDPADHADGRGLAAGAGDTDAQGGAVEELGEKLARGL